MATAPNHGLPSRALVETSKRYRLQHKIESFYPETAPLRRELYVKHYAVLRGGRNVRGAMLHGSKPRWKVGRRRSVRDDSASHGQISGMVERAPLHPCHLCMGSGEGREDGKRHSAVRATRPRTKKGIMNEAKYHLMAATRYLLLDTTGKRETEKREPRNRSRPPERYGVWT